MGGTSTIVGGLYAVVGLIQGKVSSNDTLILIVSTSRAFRPTAIVGSAHQTGGRVDRLELCQFMH